jgi:hypothetical protein
MNGIGNMKATAILAGTLLWVGGVARAADDDRLAGVRFREATHLKDGVQRFNEQVERLGKADGLDLARGEAPLTAEEVVAAIRGWIPAQHPVEDETLKKFRQIADSEVLPPGSSLHFTRGWVYEGHRFDVWWVDLSLPTGEKTAYAYRIRSRLFRSGP